MAANVPEGTNEVVYFFLRRYEPDQVQRVNLSLYNTDTPKVFDCKDINLFRTGTSSFKF